MSKINTYSSSKVFFTSDQHFGHKNIISFCDRPFNNTIEMDETLIENWNKKVDNNSIVFVLGDIGFCTEKEIIDHYSRLNGRKILIKGNHDHHFSEQTLNKLFEEVYDQRMIQIWDEDSLEHYKLHLSHYPMISWANSFHGSIQLFGHVHSTKTERFDKFNDKLSKNQYDVGVDNNNFTPISFKELKNLIRVHNISKEGNKY